MNDSTAVNAVTPDSTGADLLDRAALDAAMPRPMALS